MSQDYFDTLYQGNDDPWHYQTRWYEKRKRAITLAVLPQAQYCSAIELGCSNGVFSQELAPRCESLLCLDGNAQAVQLARQRLANLPHVSVMQASIPQDLPNQTFDLIVIGEILYYLTVSEIYAVIDWVKTSLTATGTLVCCHWRYPIAGFEQTGESVHQILQTGFTPPNIVTETENCYKADERNCTNSTVSESNAVANSDFEDYSDFLEQVNLIDADFLLGVWQKADSQQGKQSVAKREGLV